MVRHTPAAKSALAIELRPEDAPWETLDSHLLAEVVDRLGLLLWAKTKDGQKGRNRPKPVDRPGRRPEKLGRKPLPLDRMRKWLGWDKH